MLLGVPKEKKTKLKAAEIRKDKNNWPTFDIHIHVYIFSNMINEYIIEKYDLKISR